MEAKKPSVSANIRCSLGLQAAGGEGGIRTLGPPQGGQRFSRPPRSTAPAPLRAQLYGAGKPPLRSWEGADTSRSLPASQPPPRQLHRPIKRILHDSFALYVQP